MLTSKILVESISHSIGGSARDTGAVLAGAFLVVVEVATEKMVVAWLRNAIQSALPVMT